MLFHAGAVLTNRHGEPYREPKANAKPRVDDSGNAVGYADDDMRVVTHGAIAMMALDGSVPSDEKSAKDEPAKWVKAVMKREEMSSLIVDALKADGWVELRDEQAELIQERLAQFALKMNVTMVGPVISALEHPPKEKDRTEAKATKANGFAEEARA